VGLVAKFKERSKTGDVMGGVNKREAKVEGLDQLEVCVPEFEYVNLRNVSCKYVTEAIQAPEGDLRSR
jgi:hypothetical protein